MFAAVPRILERRFVPSLALCFFSSSNSDLPSKGLKALLKPQPNVPPKKETTDTNHVPSRKNSAMGKQNRQHAKHHNQQAAGTPPTADRPKAQVAPATPQVNGDTLTDEVKEISDSPQIQQQQQEPSLTPTAVKEQPPPLAASSAPVTALHEFAPKIVVVGIGGAGGNALNNMIAKELQGVDFVAMNTDAQHLSTTLTDQRIQLGLDLTKGLGCGANPESGRQAAEESADVIRERLEGSHLVFLTAGMGGGTGTGAAPVVAEICYQMNILTVAVVTLPFNFEGTHRRRLALAGVEALKPVVDTMLVIPNQNLFALAKPDTSFVDAFSMADDILLGGVKSITDLMTSPGLINLDFADVQAVMGGMGNALLGTGVATEGDNRAVDAATLALDNPLLGQHLDISTAKGVLVNITGGKDMTLFEVEKAANYITERVEDESANIIFGSAYDQQMAGSIRVSLVATGIEHPKY